MNESAWQFGECSHLSGIVTEPGSKARRIGLILVSAGLSPKCGPYRLYLRLARQLSQDGFITLRFDLGGIGDSHQAYTYHCLKTRTELDIRAAIDTLVKRFGLDGVVLGGLCSGAEDSFRYAEIDPRVVGVVMIDPFAYRTGGWKMRNFPVRAAKKILSAFKLYHPGLPEAGATAVEDERGKSFLNYKYMSHAESSRILAALIARKTLLHFVYTGGMSEFFNHKHQLREMFKGIDFKKCVTVDHFPRMGHTQLFEEDRGKIVDSITHCLVSNYSRKVDAS